MKRKIRVVVVMLGMMLVISLFGCNDSSVSTPSNTRDDSDYGAQGALNDDELSMEEMLLYAIEDEYFAHAEYAYVLETFGEQTPFTNIILSEEQHIALLRTTFETYDLSIPEDDGAEHVIPPEDVKEALQFGVQAEIDNIAMYEKFLTYELPDDVKAVFMALRDASMSHLNAFETRLDRY